MPLTIDDLSTAFTLLKYEIISWVRYKFVNIYREGVEFERQGKIELALKRYREALGSDECNDKYHRAELSSCITRIEAREGRKSFFFPRVFGGIVATGALWAVKK